MKIKTVFPASLGQQAKLSLLPVVLAMAFSSSPSSADTLAPVMLTGSSFARACTDPNDLQCNSGNEDLSVALPNSMVAKDFSSGQNTATLGQVTSVSASGLTTVPVSGSSLPNAADFVAEGSGSASLNYQFQILGPQNISVPVVTTATMILTVGGILEGVDSYFSHALFSVTLDGQGVIGQGTTLQGTVQAGDKPHTETINIDQTNFLETNTAYDVTMTVGAVAAMEGIVNSDGVSASASIDPSFVLGANAPSGYSIVFSDGIGDTPSATPLPTTLPLFAGGLGLVGFLTKRRKNAKPVHAAA